MSSDLSWFPELPERWQRMPLKAVCDYRVSNVDKVPADDELPVRLCNYTDVYNNDFLRLDMDLMRTTATQAEIDKFGLEIGDVVITKDSESWDDIGVPALIEESAPDLVCGYHLAMLRPRPRVLDGRFLLRCLQARPMQFQFERSATGVTRYGLALDAIGRLHLPVPPLPHQRKIAEFLDRETSRIDRLIAAKGRLLDLLAEKRRALITRAVTRGLDHAARLRDSGIGWLGGIPAHWQLKRLKYVGKSIIGLTFTPDNLVNDGDGTFVLRASNVRNQRIVLDDSVFVQMDIPSELITRPGDILICSRSGSRALIGKNAQIDGDSAGLTFGAFMTVFRSPCNDYLFYVFNSPVFEYQAGAFSTSTINQLTIETLNNMEVPIPPAEEQASIIAYLRSITASFDQLIDHAQQTIRYLHERRATLITRAVTGEIDALVPG